MLHFAGGIAALASEALLALLVGHGDGEPW